jgi:hypothetical protein
MLKTIRNLLVVALLAGGFVFAITGNTGCSSDDETGTAGTTGSAGTTGAGGTGGGGGGGGGGAGGTAS